MFIECNTLEISATLKTKPYSFDERIKKLKKIFRCRLQYFRIAISANGKFSMDGFAIVSDIVYVNALGVEKTGTQTEKSLEIRC